MGIFNIRYTVIYITGILISRIILLNKYRITTDTIDLYLFYNYS